ncbi:DUF1048 domain-containing protein [Actinotalea caeni]|uniref:DUF1048 domain-containing protein n=1 Tax=Actinotalea caeni TaxID=1348467 RepID=UPI0012E243CE|nr:DUF1048 domain-containing protein [Actinotalea caeni]
MVARWIEALTGSLEQKKQYKADLARIEALPAAHREAAKAFHRYVLQSGAVSDGETLVAMLTDLVDLWERAAADGTTVQAVVGEDPVEFIESFVRAYAARHWLDKERTRLVETIERVVQEES